MSIANVSETQIQQSYFTWKRTFLGDKYHWIYAIPNGAKRSYASARRVIAEGVTAGVGDVFVQYARQGFHGMFLEFKTPKGRMSEHQKKHQQHCQKENYKYVVVRSLEEAVKETLAYLSCEKL